MSDIGKVPYAPPNQTTNQAVFRNIFLKQVSIIG